MPSSLFLGSDRIIKEEANPGEIQGLDLVGFAELHGGT